MKFIVQLMWPNGISVLNVFFFKLKMGYRTDCHKVTGDRVADLFSFIIRNIIELFETETSLVSMQIIQQLFSPFSLAISE